MASYGREKVRHMVVSLWQFFRSLIKLLHALLREKMVMVLPQCGAALNQQILGTVLVVSTGEVV